MIFDDRRCELGEGALWHPTRNQMFWFDILNQKLLSQDRDGPREWRFPELVSAAGWVTDEVLLIAPNTERVHALFGQVQTNHDLLGNLTLSAGARYNAPSAGQSHTSWNASGQYDVTSSLHARVTGGTPAITPQPPQWPVSEPG